MKLRFLKITTAIIVFSLVFFGFQRLLVPKYASEVFEGNLIREYYSSAKAFDLIFLGDCEVYANFSPVTLWEEFGITSFIRGAPQQLVWHSYYLLRDTLRFETPKVVVFNVLAMQYNEPQSEPYNRLNLDGMRNSSVRLRAIATSRTENEDWSSYIFPLFRYKDRWRELSKEDITYFCENPQVSVNGFMIRCDIKPVGFLPDPIRRADYTFGDKAYYYLERMVELTIANDINLVLIKAPALFPFWYDDWDAQMTAFAKKHDLMYINMLDHIDDMGIDFNIDTFNAGLHLNVFGAQKAARFMGNVLTDNFLLFDHKRNPDTVQIWNELSQLYHKTIALQQTEIEKTGRIQTILAN